MNYALPNYENLYTERLQTLRTELTPKIPHTNSDDPNSPTLKKFLTDDRSDTQFARFDILNAATPKGLATFAERGEEEAALIETMLADGDLLIRMVVADGANPDPYAGQGRNRGGAVPPQYGAAMKIYTDIQAVSDKAFDAGSGSVSGVLERLALAIGLEHAVPIQQSNPIDRTDAPDTVDPIKRYLHYEKAFEDGELDPSFAGLSTWELRNVVNGDEPDETLGWGRETLRNLRPDHVFRDDRTWRYVEVVRTEVRYGSQNVKYDRPELQKYPNILMNGGVCGRRAFFGRFILRAFGIPTTARPQRGHAALAHYTPDGWVCNLGGGWGSGWTNTRYKTDTNFLANTKARKKQVDYLMVKRARWAGDVLGETRDYGGGTNNTDPAGFWNGVAIRTQCDIIDGGTTAIGDHPVTGREALGEWCIVPTMAEKICESPLTPAAAQIIYTEDGNIITIPAASFTKPNRNTREILTMKSFDDGGGGGQQIFLPSFLPKGTTIMRGGTWKGGADNCTSGCRMLSGGLGKYENWGFRAAVSVSSPRCEEDVGTPPRDELTLDLGDGVTMDMVYIRPGTFVMGGECTTDGRFQCIEVPRHRVNITVGFYLGRTPVTQSQYQLIQGTNPSRSTKCPDCPVDNIGAPDAIEFCAGLARSTHHEVRLPTEAEWEYAARGGSATRWFFGDDPSPMGEYAWFKPNAGGRSHPVKEKKPNPFGLYDVYGNVCERISDTYGKDYYNASPVDDPTGPSQGSSSRFEYRVEVPRAGNYVLTAWVVTVNYDQRLVVDWNDGGGSEVVIEMPFTEGRWEESAPVTLLLMKGENTLRFSRNCPPQYGLAIKSFMLVLDK